jgi:hypothetical protein
LIMMESIGTSWNSYDVIAVSPHSPSSSNVGASRAVRSAPLHCQRGHSPSSSIVGLGFAGAVVAVVAEVLARSRDATHASKSLSRYRTALRTESVYLT